MSDKKYKDIDPISLELENINNDYYIKIRRTNNFLYTPGLKKLKSLNKLLIESIIYELQKYYIINLDENFSIIGEPIENISLYGLLCTQNRLLGR